MLEVRGIWYSTLIDVQCVPRMRKDKIIIYEYFLILKNDMYGYFQGLM